MSANKGLESAVMGGMLTEAAFACASVVHKYAAPALGNFRGGVTTLNVTDAIDKVVAEVSGGDLSSIEEMLVGQAIALQSMFVTLAQRAEVQKTSANMNMVATLAFKAQAQSRATMQALVELKFPRTTAFVKQTNIAHGAQQVNNGVAPGHAPARETESISPNKLLVGDEGHGGTILDTGATLAAGNSNIEMEPMAVVHGTKKRKGQSRGCA
jgi:hypothetical protein